MSKRKIFYFRISTEHILWYNSPNIRLGGFVVKLISFCFSLLLLGGCVLPPAVTIVSLMIDGVSYGSTGKGVSDHAISQVANADCAIWYGFVEGQFCRDGLTADPAFDPIIVASAAIDSGPVIALHDGTEAVMFGDEFGYFVLTGDRGAHPR